jgi:hypothetical protein
MIFLALIALFEFFGGIIVLITAPSVIQQIAGIVALGFGALTMTVLHGIRTLETFCKNRDMKSAEFKIETD